MRSGNNYTTGVSENVRYLRCKLSGHPQPVCQKGYFVLLQEQYHDGIDYYVEDNLRHFTKFKAKYGFFKWIWNPPTIVSEKSGPQTTFA